MSDSSNKWMNALVFEIVNHPQLLNAMEKDAKLATFFVEMASRADKLMDRELEDIRTIVEEFVPLTSSIQ